MIQEHPYYGANTVWSIGIVEDVADPLKAGRVRVRILGLHDPDVARLPTSSLPWSQIMMSSVEAAIAGSGANPIGLREGSMVFGIFMDGLNRQTFLVMGSMPGLNEVVPTTIEKESDATVRDSRRGIEFVFLHLGRNGFDATQAYGILSVLTKSGAFTSQDMSMTYPTMGSRLYEKLWGDRAPAKHLEGLKRAAADAKKKPEDLETQMNYIISVLGTSSWPKVQRYATPTQLTTRTAKTSGDYALSFSQALELDWSESEVKSEIRKTRGTLPKQSYSVAYGSSFVLPRDADAMMRLLNSCERRNASGDPLDAMVVHATASFDNSVDGKTGLDSIKKFHTDPKPKGKGWSDIGYHFVIMRDGSIMIGRDINVQGAHADAPRPQYAGKSWNYMSIGVSLWGGLGKYPVKNDGTPDKQRASDIVQGRSPPKIANTPYELYTREQVLALSNFARLFKRAFPNSTIVSHEFVDRNHGHKLDPYFDVEKFLSETK